MAMIELRRASSMTDLRRSPTQKLAPVKSQGCFLAPVDVGMVACTGIRGLQQFRRSRSSSRTTGGRVNNKVRAAQEYVFKNGFVESAILATKLLSTGEVQLYKAPVLKAMPASTVALPSKPEIQSFRTYYQQNFQANSLCNEAMGWLYKQMTPSIAANVDGGAPFRIYYKKNFQSNSLSQGVMDALYKQMVPVAVREESPSSSSFQQYYKKNFMPLSRGKGPMDALYQQMAPVATSPQAEQEESTTPSAPAPASFKQYYHDNFKGNSLCQGALLDSLYKQMVPAAAPIPQPETASFKEYYQKNFQSNSLCNAAMDALYKKMAPEPVAAPEAPETEAAPFKQYYRQNFQGNSLSQGVMESLYKQMAPQPQPESAFRQYYQENFQSNALPSNAMDALYKQMKPTASPSSEASIIVQEPPRKELPISFKVKPSAASWTLRKRIPPTKSSSAIA